MIVSSPRAQKNSTKLTSDALCQLEGQFPDAAVVLTPDIGERSHPVEPLDTIHHGERAVRFFRTTTSHFLRRLSSTFHLIHHGEVNAEPDRGMLVGNSPDCPLPVKEV